MSDDTPPSTEKPNFQDITLFDQDSGEPFTFTAKEQEFFWKQGFTHVPKHSPERRKMLREQRYKGKPLFNVKCRKCGRVGKILQEPTHFRNVYCADCFAIDWEAYLEKHPAIRALHEQAALESQPAPDII